MIIFHLPGGIPIYAFSVLLALGAVLGLAWVLRGVAAKESLLHLEAGMWMLLGGLLGGRSAYVLLNWAYFSGQPWQIPQFYLGGLSGPGALAGAWLALWLVAWRKHRPFGALADVMLPLPLFLAVAAWLGCWLDGSVYGWPAAAWWALPMRDEWGAMAPRWPVQLLGAITSLALLWLLEKLAERVKLHAGMLASLGMLGLSAISFGLAFLRADVTLTWRGLRLDAWAALALAAAAFCAIVLIQLARLREKRA